MKTKIINVYSFSELSKEAKQKALNYFWDINIDYDWWSYIYEDAKNIGFKITSFDLDRNRHAKGHFELSAFEIAQNILNEHGKKCDTYKTAKAFLDKINYISGEYMDEDSAHYESEDYEQIILEIEEEFLNSLLEDYSIILQNEYEYLSSEEAIIETIQANDYEFDINGNLIKTI
jgi:hypothetical protein